MEGLRVSRKIRQHKKCFSLLELITVIMVISILATVAIPQVAASWQKSCDQLAKSALRNAAMAQEFYYLDMNTYTGRTGDLTSRGYTAMDGVTLMVIAHSNTQYTMTATHTSGTKTWTLTGPGGNIQ